MKQSGFVRCTKGIIVRCLRNLPIYNNDLWKDDNLTQENLKDKEDIVQADNRM